MTARKPPLDLTGDVALRAHNMAAQAVLANTVSKAEAKLISELRPALTEFAKNGGTLQVFNRMRDRWIAELLSYRKPEGTA
jgi:hypothetical protein